MGTDPWGFDEDRQVLAWKLRRKKRRLSWSQDGVLLVFLLVLLAGESANLRTWVLSLPVPSWVASSLFLVILYLAASLLSLPYAYLGYRLDRGYGLSVQGRRSWAGDRLKSFALGLAAVVVAGEVLLWLLATQTAWWWLLAWILGIAVNLVLGFVGPVLLAPIFFHFRPLQDPALRARFEALAAKAGVPVLGVFEMGASAKTRRSNAAVTGYGRTRRIVITDTMLQRFSPEEVETVLAHELGHQRFRDLTKGIFVGAGISLAMWGLAAWAYGGTWAGFGFSTLADMAGLPLLLLYSGIVTTALSPPELWWSRRREARADRFALEVTQNPASFAAAMVKLHDDNLGIANPPRWEKWLLYSHPPGRERVEAARAFQVHGVAGA